MAALYHPAIYDTARPVASFWADAAGAEVEGCAPLEGDERCDVAIIGGGYTGLSAAYHLARDYGVEARVLEAGPPAWGASGRNGGFCCLGSAMLGWGALIERFGLEAARDFHAAQVEAVELPKALAAEEGFGIEAAGAGEIQVAHKPSRLAALARESDFMRATFGLRAQLWSRAELAERAYAGPEAHGALLLPVGYGLNPLKYARGLARAALRHGARIHGLSRVLAWDKADGEHRLSCAGGTLRARRVVLATNGFTPENLQSAFRGVTLPILSNVITTRPLSAAEQAAQGWQGLTPVFDSRRLLFYFRMLPDGRFMLGARGGASADPATVPAKRRWMEARLGRMFPAWAGVETSHFWWGLVCFARDRLPHIGRLEDDPSVHFGLAYHGNGVAMASWTGRALAGQLAGRNDPAAIPAVMTEPLKPFPVPALRLLYLRLGLIGYRLADKFL